MTIDLMPGNSEPFAGNAGAVRNFRLRFAEHTADDHYGISGTLVVASAIGDDTPLDDLTVTLHPVAVSIRFASRCGAAEARPGRDRSASGLDRGQEAAAEGIANWLLQELGGWTSESIVRRYVRMSVDHLQPYADQLGVEPDLETERRRKTERA